MKKIIVLLAAAFLTVSSFAFAKGPNNMSNMNNPGNDMQNQASEQSLPGRIAMANASGQQTVQHQTTVTTSTNKAVVKKKRIRKKTCKCKSMN